MIPHSHPCRKVHPCFLILLAVATILFGEIPVLRAQDAPPYKNPNLAVEARVADLLGRMTLEEKVRQLDMYFGSEEILDKNTNPTADHHTHARLDVVFDPQFAEKSVGHLGVGSIHDLYPRAKLSNRIQEWVMQSNRLGIPALFIEEGLHGYMDYNETVFPQSIALATTWNPELARRTGAAIAAQARANGVDMILGPVLDVARDPRWGRVEEDFGEDPYLTGQLGLAYVEGMQGDSLNTDHTVIAEPKHFAGHGSPEGGLNTAPLHAGEREVRTVMLKSFEPAVREGKAMGIMAAYHDIDGVPCTANPWLLNKVLRDELGFQGFVLSDLGAIRRLYDTHHVADSPASAAVLALNSGVDMQFYDFGHDTFQNAIIDGVKNGKVSPETLNRAVARILRVKFMLGLFDHPFVDENLDAKVRHSAAHNELALESARQAMCLLKNDGGLLPLKKNLKRVAVIGPNANINRIGDYTEVAKESSKQGMFEQIRQLLGANSEVTFADGEDMEKAIELARNSDVAILGLGERMGISGESFDRSDLNLPGKQEQLLEAVAGAGKPVVLVLQNGRPLSISWAARHVPAILETWYAGEFGGRAIAETLFGDNNPAGRLPISFPRSVGALPDFYNHFPSKSTSYIDGDSSPLFTFGHGLSYTTFKYAGLAVTAPPEQGADDVVVSFQLTNTGTRAGDEVAQLYVRKETASVATPVKSLKGFLRVHLKPDESQKITFHLKQSDLAIWGASQEWRVEPGEYKVTVGGDSEGGLSAKFNLKP
ncbi:MAG TPA: glycoside hydrolase family 3 N-terminal domain-containing protein [Verrucomicrobiae bacterium]|jgi:beta-glucosidase|nr:glycoside hydrolase family 3 N-terminal domain-containing protein [Verrucomicrobiae bacterium]